MWFSTINTVVAGGVDWKDEKLLGDYKEQVVQVTDWWIGKAKEGTWVDLYYLRNMMLGMRTGKRRPIPCDAGRGRIAADTNGGLWPCHRFCNLSAEDSMKLGTIPEGVTNKKLLDRIRGTTLTEACKGASCAECSAELSCHALCWHESILDGNFLRHRDYHCLLWPFYLSEFVCARVAVS